MIVPYDWDLTVYIGCDYSEDITFLLNDAVVDLTGYTAYDQVRDSQSISGTEIVEFTCTVTAATGKVTLSLTDTQTSAITASTGYHSLVLRDGSGNDYVYAMGTVTFTNQATVVP